MEPIRVLYVNGGIMSRGGIESYMMNYYRFMDRKKVQIDFIVHGFDSGAYDDEIKFMGGKIYNVPVKSKNFNGNQRALKEIFLSGQYKIIHAHMDAMSMVVLKMAKKCGISIRIAHSHNVQHLTKNIIKYMLNEYARKNICRYATDLFACSSTAGKWLFGEAFNNNGIIVKNAIDIDKYRYDVNVRNRMRTELNIENKFVVGHVGRFHFQKNHGYIIDIFVEFLKLKSNAVLLLVGEGERVCEMQEKVRLLGLEDKVKFLGTRADVDRILQALDVFILPSLFEGLGIVAIEAQASGLPCFLSDTITSEVVITELVQQLSITASPDYWAKNIFHTAQAIGRRDLSEKIINAGYDIRKEVHFLQEYYLNKSNELGVS